MFIECLFRSFLLQFFNYLHKYWKNTIHFSDLTQEPLFYIKIHWNLGIELKTVSGLTYTHRKLTRNSIISKKANFWKIPIKLNKRIDAFFLIGGRMQMRKTAWFCHLFVPRIWHIPIFKIKASIFPTPVRSSI